MHIPSTWSVLDFVVEQGCLCVCFSRGLDVLFSSVTVCLSSFRSISFLLLLNNLILM